MILALLLGLILQQTGSEPAAKPVIDNERVAVFEVTTAGPPPLDAVVISFSGKAWFVAKGTAPKLEGRSLLIDLKNYPARNTRIHQGTLWPFRAPARRSFWRTTALWCGITRGRLARQLPCTSTTKTWLCGFLRMAI